MKITTRCGEDAVRGLNEALLAKAATAKLLRTDKVRADTTVIPAAVSYPTDSGLLAKAIGSMARSVVRIKAAGGATRTASRDRRRSAGRRARSIAAKLKLRGELQRDAAQAAVRRITGELAGITEAAMREATVVIRNARRALRTATGHRKGRLHRAINRLETVVVTAKRVVAQTRSRLAGVMPESANRVVSLHDVDAHPIRKGRLGKPVEFGYKAQLVDNADGVRSSASNSSSSRDTPYCSTSARVIWSMPGAPLLRRTWLHARCSTSLRWTLSYSAWNRRSGSALAARYSACCRARTASSRRSTPGAGLAHTALTGHSLSTCAWTKQRPFPSPAVVLSVRLDRYYGRLRRRPGRSPISRLVTGYRTPRSDESPQSPGRGRPPLFPPSPSQRSAPSTPRSSSRLNSRFCTASMAFTLKDGARLSFDPAAHGHFHDAADFASCCGPLSCSPLQGLSTLHFDAGRFPPTSAVCYRAPWRLPGPDSHRLATTSFQPSQITSSRNPPRIAGHTPGCRRS